MGRDPSKLGQGKAKNLEEAGLMGEYLEGLPYQSQVMGIDFSTWTNLSVGQSQAIIDNLKSLVALYQRFHDDVDRWVKLNPAAKPTASPATPPAVSAARCQKRSDEGQQQPAPARRFCICQARNLHARARAVRTTCWSNCSNTRASRAWPRSPPTCCTTSAMC